MQSWSSSPSGPEPRSKIYRFVGEAEAGAVAAVAASLGVGVVPAGSVRHSTLVGIKHCSDFLSRKMQGAIFQWRTIQAWARRGVSSLVSNQFGVGKRESGWKRDCSDFLLQ